MAIQLAKPAYLNELGRRTNNEDSIYPKQNAIDPNQKLFIVCDGVGGSNKGEVASNLACECFSEFFAQRVLNIANINVNETLINEALHYTEQKFSTYISQNPECAGMSCTLTLLYINNKTNNITIAWCGDSRVYQVRNGKILFQSEDHSLVNELVKRGEISPDEAATHPRRNVILRAISGSDSPTKADVVQINDLQTGDYFMLCTDGILEAVPNVILESILKKSTVSVEEARDLILQFCSELSNDNFSMYLLQIAYVDETNVSGKLPTGPVTQIMGDKPLASGQITGQTPAKSQKERNKFILLSVVLAVLLGLVDMQWTKTHQRAAYQKLIDKAKNFENSGQLDSAILTYKQAQVDFGGKEFASEITGLIESAETQQSERNQQIKLQTLKTDIGNLILQHPEDSAKNNSLLKNIEIYELTDLISIYDSLKAAYTEEQTDSSSIK